MDDWKYARSPRETLAQMADAPGATALRQMGSALPCFASKKTSSPAPFPLRVDVHVATTAPSGENITVVCGLTLSRRSVYRTTGVLSLRLCVCVCYVCVMCVCYEYM